MKKICLGFLMLLLVFSLSSTAYPLTSGDLTNLEVLDMHYTTRTSGEVSKDSLSVYNNNDPSVSRQLVIVLRGTTKVDSRIFAQQFFLNYTAGNESLASCLGVGIAERDDSFIQNIMLVNDRNGPSYGVPSSTFTFVVVFNVPNEVSQAKLLIVGSDKVIPLDLPSRKYSVLIMTNNLKASEVDKIKKEVATSGCSVDTSQKLRNDMNGVKILYSPKAEGAAREISQRLLTKIYPNPEIEELKYPAAHDIVITLGNGCSMKKIDF